MLSRATLFEWLIGTTGHQDLREKENKKKIRKQLSTAVLKILTFLIENLRKGGQR